MSGSAARAGAPPPTVSLSSIESLTQCYIMGGYFDGETRPAPVPTGPLSAGRHGRGR